MKVHLEKDMQLIVTPENYVEHLALLKWGEVEGGGVFLIKAYNQESAQADLDCPCGGVERGTLQDCPKHPLAHTVGRFSIQK